MLNILSLNLLFALCSSVERLANQRLHLTRDEVSDGLTLDAFCLGVNAVLSNTKAVGDEPPNFHPWLSDEGDI
ncbi:hypothetical protein TNCV_3888361 [Trichonephila clavipes]|nr:hypothetical protein TNCV_3888361 [Trichonephila clavipes]